MKKLLPISRFNFNFLLSLWWLVTWFQFNWNQTSTLFSLGSLIDWFSFSTCSKFLSFSWIRINLLFSLFSLSLLLVIFLTCNQWLRERELIVILITWKWYLIRLTLDLVWFKFTFLSFFLSFSLTSFLLVSWLVSWKRK